MDTFRRLHSNHCFLLPKHNSGSWRPCHSRQLASDFLPPSLGEFQMTLQPFLQARWEALPLMAQQKACDCWNISLHWYEGPAVIGADILSCFLSSYISRLFGSFCKPAGRHPSWAAPWFCNIRSNKRLLWSGLSCLLLICIISISAQLITRKK
jgi:hypothetical protein